MTWFDCYLAVPHRFARSRRRYAEKKAICWFKESATLHIAKAKELARICREADIATTMLTTRKPGYIVYEDRHQVTAIPFRDTFTGST